MIIILGVAGSGKSTQSKLLAVSNNLVWISIGELLRNNIKDHRKNDMLNGKMLEELRPTRITLERKRVNP